MGLKQSGSEERVQTVFAHTLSNGTFIPSHFRTLQHHTFEVSACFEEAPIADLKTSTGRYGLCVKRYNSLSSIA